MIRLLRRLFRRNDPHSRAIRAYAGAPKGQRREAYRTLRIIAHRQLAEEQGR